MPPTTTDDEHEKISDTIEKESANNLKTIKIHLQKLLLMMIINHLKHQGKVIILSLHQVPNNF